MNRFVIADPKLCIGCNSCMAGCSMVHEIQGLCSEPRLIVERVGSITAPLACRHCEDAYCEKVCPVHAITYGEDSIILDEKKCIGCKLCSVACPFGAITISGSVLPAHHPQHSMGARSQAEKKWGWQTTSHPTAVKCDLCAFQPERGAECVKVCPTKALRMVTDEEITAQAKNRRQATIGSFNFDTSDVEGKDIVKDKIKEYTRS